jgi:hypothetical protein
MTQELVGEKEVEPRVRWHQLVMKLAKHYELEPVEIEAIYAQLRAEDDRR